MKKYKVLIGKHYQLLSLTETDNAMPEDTDLYYDMGSDMKIPDFVLIRAHNPDAARERGLAFIESWKQKHQSASE